MTTGRINQVAALSPCAHEPRVRSRPPGPPRRVLALRLRTSNASFRNLFSSQPAHRPGRLPPTRALRPGAVPEALPWVLPESPIDAKDALAHSVNSCPGLSEGRPVARAADAPGLKPTHLHERASA